MIRERMRLARERLRAALAAVPLLLLALVMAVACSQSPPASPTAPPPATVPAGEPDGDTLADPQLTPDAPALVLLGTLIDGTGGDPVPDGALVIQGPRIVALGPRSETAIPERARVLEMPGATILPGFINAHVHNAYKRSTLSTWAQSGVTTVRDLGQRYPFPYFATRDRLNGDPHLAHLVAAGPLVTVPGGYPIAGNNFASLTVTSPDDASRKIAELIDEGADVIKITLTSGGAPSLSAAEAAAIVRTAHERGVVVTAHATTSRDLRRALDAGVDDVAHMATDRVSKSLLQTMVDAGVAWVPTLHALGGGDSGNLRRFVAAGGKVALGNDGGYLEGIEVGMPLREIELMHQAGLTAMQIIVAATKHGSEVCQLDHLLGTLQVGKLADVLVVKGDPLQDLDVLANAQWVVHRGVVIVEPQ
jgi:enamidase